MVEIPNQTIAPENETSWYRAYWMRWLTKAGVVGLVVVAFLLGGLYFVIKWGVMAAILEIRLIDAGI